VRIAYALDGHLYFQKGSQSPLQLTHTREFRHPIGFSEDGMKILFLEGQAKNLYSINVDGSDKQALATKELLHLTNSEYHESTTFCEPVFVSSSNLVLFRTCSHPDGYTTIYQDDLFIVDTEGNQARVVLPRGYGGHYYPSPDGSMLAIAYIGYIDLLHIDGRMIQHKLATYPISEPWPLLALVHWTEDSKELIVSLPINTFYDSSPPPTYEVWRYSAETGAGSKINLDPLPSGLDPIWPSPDGHWLLYKNYDERPFYLVDLRDGHSQPSKPDEANQPYGWSPDSRHFVYESYEPGGFGLYLSSVSDLPIFLGSGEYEVWLDDNHLIYFNLDDHAYVMKDIHGESVPILVGNTWQLSSFDSIIFYRSTTE
jgi:Tol biopolymer transport system component